MEENYPELVLEHLDSDLSVGVTLCRPVGEHFALCFVNHALLQLLGYSRDEFWGSFAADCLRIAHPDDLAEHRPQLRNLLDTGDETRKQLRLLCRDGGTVWTIEQTRRLAAPDGTPLLLTLFCDITDLIHKQHDLLIQTATLSSSSTRDPMTGVLNKPTTEQFVRQRLRSMPTSQTGVFMMIDVDNFKSINDTYGHPFGDQMLREAVRVITETFRDGDIIGRLGGDEFCVFYVGTRSRKRVEQSAQTICEGIKAIFDPQTGKPGVSCSVGIALCSGGVDFSELYAQADQALYAAKEHGRNRFAFFR